jgi:hypothetical protein
MSLVSTPSSSAVGGDAEFCLSELEERLEMTALAGADAPVYVCCACTLYDCNGDAQ